MRASTVMLIAVALYVIHRWATNQKAVDAKTVVEGVFAILVIAMLDQGQTEPVARGFAWLFLVAAAYNAIPVLTKATGTGTPASGISKITGALPASSGGVTTA